MRSFAHIRITSSSFADCGRFFPGSSAVAPLARLDRLRSKLIEERQPRLIYVLFFVNKAKVSMIWGYPLLNLYLPVFTTASRLISVRWQACDARMGRPHPEQMTSPLQARRSACRNFSLHRAIFFGYFDKFSHSNLSEIRGGTTLDSCLFILLCFRIQFVSARLENKIPEH